jgi:hypothetical protein
VAELMIYPTGAATLSAIPPVPALAVNRLRDSLVDSE